MIMFPATVMLLVKMCATHVKQVFNAKPDNVENRGITVAFLTEMRFEQMS